VKAKHEASQRERDQLTLAAARERRLKINWDAKVLPANLRAQLKQIRNRFSASNAR